MDFTDLIKTNVREGKEIIMTFLEFHPRQYLVIFLLPKLLKKLIFRF